MDTKLPKYVTTSVPDNMIRVRLELNPDSWHGTLSEGIWAKLVRPLVDKAIAEVDNIPFFSKAVSFGDKIIVALKDNQVVLDAVAERGGHSTYRIFFQSRNEDTTKLLQILNDLGCGWEKTKFNGGELFAVDLPPQADIYNIYDIFEKGQREGRWLFEEGYVGHPLEGDPTSTIM